MNPLFKAFTILSGLWTSYGVGKRVTDIFKFRNDDKANYPSSSLKNSEEQKKEYTKNLQTEKIRREKAYQKAITDLLPTLGKDTEQSIKDITPDKLKKAISEYIKETLTESNFNMDIFKKLLKDRKRLDKFIEAFFKGFNLTELKLTNIANMMVGYIGEQVLDHNSPIFQIAYQANQLNAISQHETALKNMDTSKMTDEDHEALKNIGIYLENPPSMLESIWLDAKNGRERLEQDQAQKELEEAISKVEQPSQELLDTPPTSTHNTRPEPLQGLSEDEPPKMRTIQAEFIQPNIIQEPEPIEFATDHKLASLPLRLLGDNKAETSAPPTINIVPPAPKELLSTSPTIKNNTVALAPASSSPTSRVKKKKAKKQAPTSQPSLLGSIRNTFNSLNPFTIAKIKKEQALEKRRVIDAESMKEYKAHIQRSIDRDPSMEYFYSAKYQEETQFMYGGGGFSSNTNSLEANNFSSPARGSSDSNFNFSSNDNSPLKLDIPNVDDFVKDPKLIQVVQNIANNEAYKQLYEYNQEIYKGFQDESPVTAQDRDTLDQLHGLIVDLQFDEDERERVEKSEREKRAKNPPQMAKSLWWMK